MRIGWNLGYWSSSPPEGVATDLASLEAAGLDSVWTAETYGSDALTPLAWWGASTDRLRLGTAVCQLSARTPSAMAMAAMTLDHLSAGRFALGLGVSGPQVVEGWYGRPFSRPLSRTREYIAIMRDIWRREAPLVHEGDHYRIPYEGGTGLGKPLRSSIRPLRPTIPILLAAEGPKNVALAAELADGWLAFLYSPEHHHLYAEPLERGTARRTDDRASEELEIVATVPVSLDDELEVAARPIREMLALYIGGMGARGANFHLDVVERMGFGAAAEQIQRHFLAGERERAVAAVPMELVDHLALVGDTRRVTEGLRRWERSPVGTLLVQGPASVIGAVLDAAAAGPATPGASTVPPRPPND